MSKTTYKRKHLTGAYSFKTLVAMATVTGNMVGGRYTWFQSSNRELYILIHKHRQRQKEGYLVW